VLSNLIDNAAKYGGKHIEVGLKKAQKINLTITDDGGNIPKGQQQRIFEKFYRIPKGNVHDVKGFGIGLYYTKTIIEKHGGTIEVESNLKKTIFKITLP
jgi:two-component system phosphate regulon sensor histidine kinase PhoR